MDRFKGTNWEGRDMGREELSESGREQAAGEGLPDRSCGCRGDRGLGFMPGNKRHSKGASPAVWEGASSSPKPRWRWWGNSEHLLDVF